MARIKKDDIVKIISGKNKGVTGKVIAVLPKKNAALIENVGTAKRKVKPSQINPQGGMKDIHVPTSMHKIALVVDEKSSATSRVGYSKNDDGKTVRAMDILFPGIGEIVGGSQREERYDVLKQKIADLNMDEQTLWWYLDLRKFGTAVHSGFGLGFERLVLFATGMTNIRDVIPYPRTPQSAEF